MKKVITTLFMVLFCFTVGIGECQEKKLSEEEKVELKKNREKQEKVINEILSLGQELMILEEKYEEKYKELKEKYKPLKEELDALKAFERKLEGKKDVYELILEERELLDKTRKDSERLLDELSSQKFSLEMDRILFEGKMRFLEGEIDMQRMMFLNDMMFLNQLWDPFHKDQLWLYLLLLKRK